MNFLAHLALAHPEEPLMVGGFLGDFVKGVLNGDRPEAIEKGIRLHRSIDAFTASEPTMCDSGRYFDPKIRRFVPIVIDIIGDHFLATNFETHQGETLSAFAKSVYDVLERHREWMPPAAERYRKGMTERDTLVRYQDCATLRGAFDYVARRFDRADVSEGAMEGLANHYDELASDFLSYYPRLVDHARRWQCEN